MSRSNSEKPFYVDVGTSIVAVRCASNHDIVLEYDHSRHPSFIEFTKTACDRMNREAEIRNSGDCAKLREALVEVHDKLLLWNYTDEDTAKMAVALIDKCDKALAATEQKGETDGNK